MSLTEKRPQQHYSQENPVVSVVGVDGAVLLQHNPRSPETNTTPQASEGRDAGQAVTRKTPSPAPPAVILASAGYDHTIRFWDVIQGQVNCLALSRDKLLLAAGGNPAIRLYDVVAATAMQLPGGGSGNELRGGAMTASDSSLTAATTTANILPVHIFEVSASTNQSGGSGGNVMSVAFHPEGLWLWSASEEGRLRVWDLQGNFGLRREISLGTSLTAAMLFPDQEHALVGDEMGRLRLIRMELSDDGREGDQTDSDRELGRMGGRGKMGKAITSLPPTAATPTTLNVAHQAQVAAETRTPQRVAIRDIDISFDGNFVAAIDHRGQLHLWRLDRAPMASDSSMTDKVEGVGIGDETIQLTVSTKGAAAHVGASVESRPVHMFEFTHVASVNAHSSYGIKCMFSPDGTTILTTSADTTARLWAMPVSGEPGEGEQERSKNDVRRDAPTPTPSGSSLTGEAPSSSSSRASGVDSVSANTSNATTLLVPPVTSTMGSREVSRGGSPYMIAMSSSVVSSLPLIQEFIGHTKWVWDCAFSADSAYVITASSDESIRLWDVNSGLSIATYAGHSKAITCVALNDLPLQ